MTGGEEGRGLVRGGGVCSKSYVISFSFVCVFVCKQHVRKRERKKEQSEVKVKICIITSSVSLYIWLALSFISLSIHRSTR